MSARKTPAKPGSRHAREAGLVPVQLLLPPGERERVRAAALYAGDRGMAAFARRVVEEAARKLVSDKELEKIQKKRQNGVDSVESTG